MKKESWLSLILPAIYLVPAVYMLAECLIYGLGNQPVFQLLMWMMYGFPAIPMIICCVTAVILIVKFRLSIGQHMPLYLLTTLGTAVVAALSWLVYYKTRAEWTTAVIPAAAAVLAIGLLCRKIKDKKERAVMILCSPVVYYMAYIISLSVAWAMGY